MDVLITGGTGSFGQAFARAWLTPNPPLAPPVASTATGGEPGRVIVYSRDEAKQGAMRRALETEFPGEAHRLRFFLGDVRDGPRLRRALDGVQLVVHAAALKQVPALEYNPAEAVKTNIQGALNLIDAAIDAGVAKVIALSSDKACAPANLYGATKMVMEKLLTQANVYSPRTRFACVRYGNVLGSRGSVIPLWRAQAAGGKITITDPGMTRFFLTLDQAVAFVRSALARMQGGEVFVPQLRSVVLGDLARAVAPGVACEVVGLRPGEKMHEVLISADEAGRVRELPDACAYVIYPAVREWAGEERGTPVAQNGNGGAWEYGSCTAARLPEEELKRWLATCS